MESNLRHQDQAGLLDEAECAGAVPARLSLYSMKRNGPGRWSARAIADRRREDMLDFAYDVRTNSPPDLPRSSLPTSIAGWWSPFPERQG